MFPPDCRVLAEDHSSGNHPAFRQLDFTGFNQDWILLDHLQQNPGTD